MLKARSGTLISDMLRKLLSTPEGRQRFADSVRDYVNRPLRPLRYYGWSKALKHRDVAQPGKST